MDVADHRIPPTAVFLGSRKSGPAGSTQYFHKKLKSVFLRKIQIRVHELEVLHNMNRVRGVVVITGSNRGIGFELTRCCLINYDNVTKVYATCRNSDKAEPFRFEDESIKSAIQTVRSESDHINLLINNAAILEKDHKCGIVDGQREAWLRHFDINVVSYAMMIHLCEGTDRVHGNYAYMCSKEAQEARLND
ncbi:hypothetical protein DICVIV_13102 [Dictyocaulus viviparus]|uniref:Oxidoreductase, short chain dehydrogenase/reductase family protein n=1 Tax=Dictyocaulus viviparus TaxID=29172 RepID=A0A0D8XAY9_DICVI|nr:hypothetical protein DICVIV_13102 [Dictyocaulus viviparus]